MTEAGEAEAPPRTLERWDSYQGIPRDYWKYSVYVNGVHEPRAVKADAKRGVVTAVVMNGMIYSVKDAKTEQRAGTVQILLKPAFRDDLKAALGGV